MTDILERQLAPSAHAVESPVGDETVILHLVKGTYYGLDAVGTQIWALLKEGLAPREICRRLEAEYKIDQAEIEADARAFLTDLEANGMLEDC
jgi:PqqD family protein of HPr-rel-A system